MAAVTWLSAALLAASAVAPTNVVAAPRTYIVVTLQDLDGECSAASCSLRQAINSTNRNQGRDTIAFSFPGDAVPHTIRPTRELPPIREPVVIDGTTEPSFAVYGHPVVEIDGSQAPPAAVGLRIRGGRSDVRGLVINRFGTRGSSTGGASGIVIESAGRNVIEGNYIGTDVFGHADLGNRLSGISIQGSTNNRIGGATPAQRNLISGNGTGIGLSNAGSNEIVGNYVGVDAEGDNKLGNEIGVHLAQSTANTVGGPTAGSRNVISANAGAGVQVSGSDSRRNVISGNLIGTDAAGTANFGNFRGVFFTAGALGNTVGGTTPGAGNVIAFNSETGVHVPENGQLRSLRISILGNSIHSNGIPGLSGLGIDLTPNPGVTPNDVGDRDMGANRLMNFPVLTSASSDTSSTTITGTLDSEASHSFRVEFFAGATCDPSGHGEGPNFLGSLPVNTAGTGHASFTFTTSTPTTPDWFVTATSTEAEFGNTSEFGACRVVERSGDPPSWVVNTESDVTDSTGCTVSHCSLREAIERANAESGRDTITFDIPDSTDTAPHLISPTTPFDPLTEPVVIDGSSEPDFVNPVVRVDGISAGASAVGFQLAGGQSQIRGLSITRFKEAQVLVASDSNAILGNWIGLTPEGNAADRAPGTGVRVTGKDNDVGTEAPADRNFISGHEDFQIHLLGEGAHGNLVSGNTIGTLPDGGQPPGVTGDSYGGILVESAHSNVIGTAHPNGGNILRGTAYDAIRLVDSSSTAIFNNDIARTSGGGWNHGIVIHGGSNSLIGSDAPGDSNLISGASGMGVLITAGVDHLIIGNRMGPNGEQSIDLGPYDSVTVNDTGDGDAGPNGLQNYPVLLEATRRGDVVVVSGTLNSTARTDFRIDLYATYRGTDTRCEGPSRRISGVDYNFGDLDEWVGAMPDRPATDDAGSLQFTVTTQPAAVDEGLAYIMATASGPDGTSEGSACIRVNDLASAFVRADGQSLSLAGQPWYLYGASTYHSSNRGGPNDDDAVIAMAVDAGLNTLRLGEWFEQTTGEATAPYDAGDWAAVDLYLVKMRDAGLRAILDLSAFRNFLMRRDIAQGGWTDLCRDDGSVTPEERATVDFASISPYRQGAYAEWDAFISFVANRINTVSGVAYRDDPTIAIVSFAGEPHPPQSFLCGMPADTDELTDFYGHVFAEWKQHDSRHLLSSGGMLHLDWEELHGDADGSGIDWQAIFALSTHDVPTLHTYPARIDDGVPVDYQTPKVSTFLANLGKPWFTEEFGWRQEVGDATRAGYYEWLYQRQLDYGSTGAAFWNLGFELAGGTFDVGPQTPDTWAAVQAHAPPTTAPAVATRPDDARKVPSPTGSPAMAVARRG
jgi:hypothetical protein